MPKCVVECLVGESALLALQTFEGELWRLRLILLAATLHIQLVPEVLGTILKDYENTELVFKRDGRPGLRYFSWH